MTHPYCNIEFIMDQRKPIHIAAAQGDVELLRQELEKGVSPDTRDETFGTTPLH